MNIDETATNADARTTWTEESADVEPETWSQGLDRGEREVLEALRER